MKIKLRHDLEFIKRALKFDEYWVVKDPISFNHFLFSSQEFQLLQLFDGARTHEDVQQQWQQQFSTRSLTLQQVGEFANRLIRDNLVAVNEFGYGGSLYQIQASQKKQRIKSMLLSPLVIRFRGINPKHLLDNLAWFSWIMFHPLMVVVSMIFALLVLVYTLGHFDELAYRVPAISQLLSAQGILGIAITVSVVKILHELGHAMACRRCGGECFEIGLILLAFIPTLFCNVSDAWTFPERWKRLLVSFGGIYVEIILAALAAVVWLSTEPGLLNAIMFNVMVLCSINTVLINGNPLLRYDGYYLLSDFTEQPNLSSISREALSRFINSLFFIPKGRKRHPNWILVYAILSFLYRWFVVLSIIVMVYVFLKSVGLRVVGQYVMLFLAFGIIARPLMSIRFSKQQLNSPGRLSQLGKFSLVRSAFPIAFLSLSLAIFCYVPMPSHVRCNLIVEADAPTPIYVPSNGKLTYIVDEFERVQVGQTIAKIESIEIDQQLQRVQNNLNRNRNLLQQLRLRANQDPLAATQMVLAKRNIETDESELAVLQEEQRRLDVKSPVAGVAYPAPVRKSIFKDKHQPRKWQGHLTDDLNRNCFVERSDQLLSIHAASQKTVTLFVGEREIDFVKQDQPVKLLFAQLPGQLFEGTVGEIYEVDVDVDDREVSDTGMETYEDASGTLKSLQTPYRVTVTAKSIPAHAFVRSGGRARISIPNQTLAQKTLQFLDRLAKFNL